MPRQRGSTNTRRGARAGRQRGSGHGSARSTGPGAQNNLASVAGTSQHVQQTNPLESAENGSSLPPDQLRAQFAEGMETEPNGEPSLLADMANMKVKPARLPRIVWDAFMCMLLFAVFLKTLDKVVIDLGAIWDAWPPGVPKPSMHALEHRFSEIRRILKFEPKQFEIRKPQRPLPGEEDAEGESDYEVTTPAPDTSKSEVTPASDTTTSNTGGKKRGRSRKRRATAKTTASQPATAPLQPSPVAPVAEQIVPISYPVTPEAGNTFQCTNESPSNAITTPQGNIEQFMYPNLPVASAQGSGFVFAQQLAQDHNGFAQLQAFNDSQDHVVYGGAMFDPQMVQTSAAGGMTYHGSFQYGFTYADPNHPSFGGAARPTNQSAQGVTGCASKASELASSAVNWGNSHSNASATRENSHDPQFNWAELDPLGIFKHYENPDNQNN
ncbi:hypothetical protein BDV25DRAFT_135779 [Aspergillus avenaceus]|uniref:Uncharacterized protein n=1 Tax=Aspergillus avenaceus TaxID=36643 RepID=A0A5N6U909_ASPAV|nr:hypothetical protein BDV25DRAFT_135779 [Aspergillus avenaceus]